MSIATFNQRLEQYTLKRPKEVLLVSATIDGESDQVIIFRGFSSSLVRSTASNPDLPILPDHAIIETIDRLQGPYSPYRPDYIQQGLTPETMSCLLTEVGV